jgi:hypothetical protein
MYITPHLHVVKDSCIFFETYFNFFELKISQILICEWFLVWIIGYYHLNFFFKIIEKSWV